MTTLRMVVSLGLLAGGLGACASDRARPGEPGDDTGDGGGGGGPGINASVDYRLTGGFVPRSTTLHIEPNGAATRSLRTGESEAATLPTERLDDLQRKIDDARFPTLAREYGCGGCADDPLHTIAVQIDGTVYMVEADDSADYPERLRPVIKALREIPELPLDWH